VRLGQLRRLWVGPGSGGLLVSSCRGVWSCDVWSGGVWGVRRVCPVACGSSSGSCGCWRGRVGGQQDGLRGDAADAAGGVGFSDLVRRAFDVAVGAFHRVAEPQIDPGAFRGAVAKVLGVLGACGIPGVHSRATASSTPCSPRPRAVAQKIIVLCFTWRVLPGSYIRTTGTAPIRTEGLSMDPTTPGQRGAGAAAAGSCLAVSACARAGDRR
jgi:hypothetical protein